MLYSPLLLALVFGVYSFSVIAYNIITFRECPQAALELQNDLKLAKDRLIRDGFEFDE